MGRMATLSPLGLYNWDPTLFDLMEIPAAIDREVLVQNLLAQTAELEVLYPNPVVFKNLLSVWSRKQIEVWTKLWETTQYEYNPIENYNRYETGAENGSGKTTHSGTDTSTETLSRSGTDTTTEATTHGGTDRRTESVSGSGQDEASGNDKKGHWVAGYDAPTPTAQDDGLFKQTRDEDEYSTNSGYERSESTTETKTYGETINKTGGLTHGEQVQKSGGMTHGEEVETVNAGGHELHARGNIGVTTTQDMIRQERQIDLFNIYDIIIADFKMRFCILIY